MITFVRTAGRRITRWRRHDGCNSTVGMYPDTRTLEQMADDLPASEPRWPRRCAKCGRDHSALAWSRLPHPPGGRYADYDDVRLEFRNCQCGSTLTVEMPK